MAILHWLQLAMTEGIGPILIGRLIERMGTAESACGASLRDLQEIEGLGSAKATKVHRSMREARDLAEKEYTRAQKLGMNLICREDEAYPPLLREIPDPPPVLYVRGTIEPRDLNAVAIVGSRRCSNYGREQAERFGALLGGAGFTVTSGGARGIDSAAHHGAMRAVNGRTIAVLGCGLDVVYPPENTGLFDQIAERGAVVSEYPLGTAPLAENFPRRNRIVSGMSRGALVIEADLRSGALITARQAGEDHNRTVMALPGRVDNALSAGPHMLIRDGAILVTNIEEIVEALGPISATVREGSLFDFVGSSGGEVEESNEKQHEEPAPSLRSGTAWTGLSEVQRGLLEQMETDTVHIDTLMDRTGLEAHEVLRELTFLSLKGLVKRVDGQTFVRAGGGKG